MENRKSYSLNQKLTVVLITTTIFVWLLSSYCIYYSLQKASNEIFDQSLAETAHSLISMTIASSHLNTLETVVEHVDGEHFGSIVFQIWHKDGHLIYRSVGVGKTPIFPASNGFGWINIDQSQFRSYSVWDASHLVQVQIAQKAGIRIDVMRKIIYDLFLISCVFLPLLSFLIFKLIQNSFQSLGRVTQSIANQSIARLEAIHQPHVPREIQPLITSLNLLLEQIADNFEREKRFTANAAHELRTPLAAIRLHTQVLQHARTPQEANEAFQDIFFGVDRCSRMIEQLLTLARIDPQVQSAQVLELLNLEEVIKEVVSYLEFEIRKEKIEVHYQMTRAMIRGQREQIAILLRNLIDNAIRYRGTGTIIELSCGVNSFGESFLRISDEGIGIPEAQYQVVFDRFYRAAKETSTGSGLGLSIVEQIAHLHHAQLKLSEGLNHRGLSVLISFTQKSVS